MVKTFNLQTHCPFSTDRKDVTWHIILTETPFYSPTMHTCVGGSLLMITGGNETDSEAFFFKFYGKLIVLCSVLEVQERVR